MTDNRHDRSYPAAPAIDGRALLRHQLAGLAFRFAHAVGDAPADFASFEAGHDVRTPLAIIRHVAGVLEHGRRHLQHDDTLPRRVAEGDESAHKHAMDAWSDAVDAVYRALETLDTLVSDTEVVQDDDRMRAFVHGPLTDAATHVGQVAMLRRLAGHPVAPVGYFRADVRAGRIRPSDSLT